MRKIRKIYRRNCRHIKKSENLLENLAIKSKNIRENPSEKLELIFILFFTNFLPFPSKNRHYRSLAEFFARSLKEDARTIDEHCCLVSPCDGRVLNFGSASDSNIEQVKGVSYSLEAFLGPKWHQDDSSPYVECLKHKNSDTALYQCIIYLAPGDYHRFHSPTSWKPEIRRHFHGELLSVSPKIAQWVPGLFALNERALYIGKWEYGFFSFTAVGESIYSLHFYLSFCLSGWR